MRSRLIEAYLNRWQEGFASVFEGFGSSDGETALLTTANISWLGLDFAGVGMLIELAWPHDIKNLAIQHNSKTSNIVAMSTNRREVQLKASRLLVQSYLAEMLVSRGGCATSGVFESSRFAVTRAFFSATLIA